MKTGDKKDFSRTLLKWNRTKNSRQMPWKGEKNPYFVWLSEIILQQTRVEQGLPYYLRFKSKFPNVKSLASAPEDEVMKLWQGLGYYSRARNLHETAKNIQNNLGGKFPSTFAELKKLKGVGDYTASAIASFVYGENKAVVDGNVIRVLARYFGVKEAFDTSEGKKKFAALAQELIDAKNAGEYNQAIMDFGATVCLPQNPKCMDCPFAKSCYAYQQDEIDSLPAREKRTKVTDRYFNYLMIRSRQEVFIRKRQEKDIWKGLYELPLMETKAPLKRNLQTTLSKFLNTKEFSIASKSEKIVQKLSHRNIHFIFIEITMKNFRSFRLKGAEKVRMNDLNKFAFPKTIQWYLEEKF